ncbi:MAG: YdcF family protein, partial [Myxococcales bacterium]|nr:YdcF family protein [Myxococcales bacterium]
DLARSIWLVTQPFHGRRSLRLFRHAGFDARVWHIADSLQYRDRRRAMRWLVREYAAWVLLLLRGP